MKRKWEVTIEEKVVTVYLAETYVEDQDEAYEEAWEQAQTGLAMTDSEEREMLDSAVLEITEKV